MSNNQIAQKEPLVAEIVAANPESKILEIPVDPYYITSLDSIIANLQAHLDLGTPANEGATMIIRQVRDLLASIKGRKSKVNLSDDTDAIVNLINDLDQSSRDLLDSARADADELRIALSNQLFSGPGTIPFERLDPELDRRAQASEEISQIQEQCEDEATELRSKIHELSQMLSVGICDHPQKTREEKSQLEKKLAMINQTIHGLVEATSSNHRTIKLLQNYREAVILVRTGLPDKILREKLFSK